jgi:hypothetical protein
MQADIGQPGGGGTSLRSFNAMTITCKRTGHLVSRAKPESADHRKLPGFQK